MPLDDHSRKESRCVLRWLKRLGLSVISEINEGAAASPLLIYRLDLPAAPAVRVLSILHKKMVVSSHAHLCSEFREVDDVAGVAPARGRQLVRHDVHTALVS